MNPMLMKTSSKWLLESLMLPSRTQPGTPFHIGAMNTYDQTNLWPGVTAKSRRSHGSSTVSPGIVWKACLVKREAKANQDIDKNIDAFPVEHIITNAPGWRVSEFKSPSLTYGPSFEFRASMNNKRYWAATCPKIISKSQARKVARKSGGTTSRAATRSLFRQRSRHYPMPASSTHPYQARRYVWNVFGHAKGHGQAQQRNNNCNHTKQEAWWNRYETLRIPLASTIYLLQFEICCCRQGRPGGTGRYTQISAYLRNFPNTFWLSKRLCQAWLDSLQWIWRGQIA